MKFQSLCLIPFFTNNVQTQSVPVLPVKKELRRYLDDEDTSLESLRRYPILKNIFTKFNTPLPSSGPVERLFSFAGVVNSQRRQKLSDENFEKLVIGKANK